MAGRREDVHSEKQRQARRDLERVEEQSVPIGASHVRRSADRARDHFLGTDGDPDDKIEIWGKRIGRILSLVGLIVLAIYLFRTYL
ncbi:MAG: hypothetical protein K8F25_01705 [Fimbriimonadaceae bacterium]|nr:hypothetical protein [Alphaproteobacteria bacterium]